MNITLTGATGFIGNRLVKRLLDDGHSLHLLGRRTNTGKGEKVRYSVWDTMQGPPPEAALAGADAVIHLAGEPVAQRWDAEVKRRIRASRVDGTRHLIQGLSTLSKRPAVLISASAIGIYGDRGDEELVESSAPGEGFLEDVSVAWEREARLAESLGIRVVVTRIGVVLGSGGGALAKMIPPFKMGVGGVIGSGKQWMSWIHVDDLVGLIAFALGQESNRGPMNATAPKPVTNAEFTRELAHALHRPALFPVPSVALKVMFGEMSQVLLGSQRVLPKAALDGGYLFRFPELGPALADILR